MGAMVSESTAAEVAAACAAAERAAPALAALPLAHRAALLDAVADALDAAGDELVALTDKETALGVAVLAGELTRTTGQLRLMAAEVRRPDFLGVVDEGVFHRTLRPIGPVAVYAASNFPLALSVAGSDTAAALAAGCPVVVKAHPGHPGASRLTGELVAAALRQAGAPEGTFAVLHGFDAGRRLVTDPHIRAASFTGSLAGGRALFDAANARPDPIPFYGELGSVNPVFVTRAAIEARGTEIAEGYVASATLGVGQFCTNPGLVFLPVGHGLADRLAEALDRVAPAPMLNERIAAGFRTGAERLAARTTRCAGTPDGPQLFTTTVTELLARPELREEVFGPASLIVEYGSEDELMAAAAAVPGSLTATIHAEPGDAALARRLLPVLSGRVGRVVWNGWPTGVAVNRAMHHGGPWPATTNPLFTSIGTAGIRRFQVPVVYQGVPAGLLT
jgi:NADP-dependent aldehyde dehydrogenase